MPVPSAYCANALGARPNRRQIAQGESRRMSERQARNGSEARMSSSAPRPLRRVRMLTTGRWHPPLDARLMPTVIAVGSAEPGIGKSVVVSNLAASIAGLGRRVVVVDLDFRAPRQHTLFGVKWPEGGRAAGVEGKRDRRDEPPQQTRVRNLRLLPGPLPVDPGGAAGISL